MLSHEENFFKKIISRHSLIITILVLFFGVFFLVWQYLVNRSLWLDEAMLSLNILDRSFIGLIKPLDMNQGAPLLFLFIEKIFITIFGKNEFALRAFPLITGVATLLLSYLIGKDFFSKKIGNFILLLVIFSPNLIRYSSEVKQYSSDVFATLLLILITKELYTSNYKKSNFLKLALVGSILICLSHAVIFSIISICFILIILFFSTKEKSIRNSIFLIILIWLIIYLFLFLISLNSLKNNNVLVDYWQSSFMPFPPWKNINWFKEIFKVNLIEVYSYFSNPRVFSFFFIIGLFTLIFHKNVINNLLLILPIPLCLAFSGFKVYPFSGRMLLFTIPLVYLIFVVGINSVSEFLYKYHENKFILFLFPLLLILLLFSNIFSSTFNGLKEPFMGEHIRPIIYKIIENKEKDNIYIYYSAKPATEYYFELFNFVPSNVFWGSYNREDPENYLREIDSMEFQGKTWFIFSHNCSWCSVNEQEFILEYLKDKGKLLEQIDFPGANGYLFSF